jgi:putative nucleotidyltransferase with HDIG domain
MLLLDVDIRQRLLVARIPAMPQILVRLIAQCQAEKTGIAELAELIATDSAIAARVLEVATSSAYHRKKPSVSIHQALMTLGTDTVKMLLINESVFQLFDQFAQKEPLDFSHFWKHAIAAALTAKMIAQRTGYAHAEEAYLAGLLHDIGRLALLAAAPEEYGLDFNAEDDEILCASEQRTLQITHAEAGALLVDRWSLDSFIADSILYHHEPAPRLEGTHPLIRIVFVAHLLSGDEPDRPALDAAALLCELSEADIAGLRAEVSEKLKKVAEEMDIDLANADKPKIAGTATAPSAKTARPPGADAVRQRMAQEMRSMTMASEMARYFGNVEDEPRLHAAITQALGIVSDIDDAVILLVDDKQEMLRGTPAGKHSGRIRQFSAALTGSGPLAACVQQQRVMIIDDQAPSLGVPEEQLLRMLATDSVVSVPIVSDRQCTGLLIGAIARWRQPAMRERESFLGTLGVQAGQALQKLRNTARESVQQADAVAGQFREASRQLAHEVNNPLSIIRNYLGVLDHKLGRAEPVQTEISILSEEIDRVGQIVSGLANFKTSPCATTGHVNVNRVIQDVVRLMRETAFASSSVKLIAKPQESLPDIAVDPGTAKQIVLNLVKNAVEALPGTGEIEVGSRGPVNRDGRLYVEIWVRDNGPGIPASMLPALFTEVQSTKDSKQRGLGLTIVHRLVKEAQGFIACRSDATGTTFELLLPGSSGADQPAAP